MSWEQVVPGAGGIGDATTLDQIAPGAGGVSTFASSDATVVLTGVEVTTAVGEVSAEGVTIVTLTGVQVTAAVGDVTFSTSTTVIPESVSVAAIAGEVDGGSGIVFTADGVEVTASAGDVTVTSSVTVILQGVQVAAQAGLVSVPLVDSGLTPIRAGGVGRGFFGMYVVEAGQGEDPTPGPQDGGAFPVRIGTGKFAVSMLMVSAPPIIVGPPVPTVDAGPAAGGFGFGGGNTTTTVRSGSVEMLANVGAIATVDVSDRIIAQGQFGFGFGGTNNAVAILTTTAAGGFGFGGGNIVVAQGTLAADSSYGGFGFGGNNAVNVVASTEAHGSFGFGGGNTIVEVTNTGGGGSGGASTAEIVAAIHANPPPLTTADLTAIQAAVVGVASQLADANWQYSMGPNHSAKALMRLVGAATFGKGQNWKFNGQWQMGDQPVYLNIEGTKAAITYQWDATANRMVVSTDAT